MGDSDKLESVFTIKKTRVNYSCSARETQPDSKQWRTLCLLSIKQYAYTTKSWMVCALMRSSDVCGITEGSWKSVFMARNRKSFVLEPSAHASLWYCVCVCWANRENNFIGPLSVTCLSRTEQSELSPVRIQMTLGVAHLQHLDQRQPLCALEMCTIDMFFCPTLIRRSHTMPHTHYWAELEPASASERKCCYLLFFLNNRTALSWFFLLGQCQYDDCAPWISQHFSFFYQ